MIRNLFFGLLLIFSIAGFAQNVDYNEVILPFGRMTNDFAEKLVRLAWANDPESAGVRASERAAVYNVKLAGAEWLNTIVIQGNLNEFNINPEEDIFNRSQFLPRYNFGVRLTLGTFLTIPYQTRLRRQELEVARSAVNDRMLAIRASVLRLYNNYLMQQELYTLQAEMSSIAENTYRLAEQKFRSAEISYEEYTLARTAYNEARVLFLQTQSSFRNSKIDLEEMIGIPLEDVM